VSTRQVKMRNSERRRKALVSSCACMRLESAMRTVTAAEGSAEERLMKQDSERNGTKNVILGVRGEVLKETCHKIRRRAFKSGTQLRMLWKTDERDAGVWKSCGSTGGKDGSKRGAGSVRLRLVVSEDVIPQTCKSTFVDSQ